MHDLTLRSEEARRAEPEGWGSPVGTWTGPPLKGGTADKTSALRSVRPCMGSTVANQVKRP